MLQNVNYSANYIYVKAERKPWPGPDFTNKLMSMLRTESTMVLKTDNTQSWDCYWVWVCLWNQLKIVDLTLSKLVYF